MAALRGACVQRVAGDLSTSLELFKIVGDALLPARPDADLDEAVRWLVNRGYIARGAIVGVGTGERPAVFWLKPGDEPEYLGPILGCPVAPGSVRYIPGEGRLATTLTRREIQRLRRRHPLTNDDLAFQVQPTKAQLERLYGVSL